MKKKKSLSTSGLEPSRGSQLESVNTNEINRDIHLAYTLF